MGFPNNLLDEDERIAMHLHPHWKTLFMPVLWLLIIGGVVGLVLAKFDNSIVLLIVGVLGLLAIAYLTVLPVLRWMTTHFVLTTHRVMTRKGILKREGRDVPLGRINDVSFSHTIIERVLGAGTLVVESAGERGQVVLRDVPRAEAVQSRLYRLVEDDAERRAAMHHTPPAGPQNYPPQQYGQPPAGQPGFSPGQQGYGTQQPGYGEQPGYGAGGPAAPPPGQYPPQQ